MYFGYICNLYFAAGVDGAKMGKCIGRAYGNIWVEIEAVVFFISMLLINVNARKKYLTMALRAQSGSI